tara:strand:- start:675 stop:779 length:105 start_codon:yes stop_codon:yes gene_type:complete
VFTGAVAATGATAATGAVTFYSDLSSALAATAYL